MFRKLMRPRSSLIRASAHAMVLVVLAAGAVGTMEQEGATVSESKSPNVSAPIAVQERRLELSGCAVVEGGILVVEDELIGAVLLLEDPSQRPLSLSTIKLERKKKARAPYADAFKLFPFQDFEDIASDGGSTVYLLGSHHGKEGERRPDREFLFRADWDMKSRELKVVGEQYGLLKVIAPLLETLGCGIGLTTTEVNETLNMEGLALHGDTLYLGLRSPLTTAGKAIILYGSAQEIMAGTTTLQPLELDLNGGGVRALDWDGASGTLLILGGPASDTPGGAGLYAWNPVDGALANLVTFEPDIARKGPEGVCRLPRTAGGKLLVVLDGEGGEHGAEFIEIDG